MLRLKGCLEVVDTGEGFDVMRAGCRTPLVSFYTATGNVYVMHGSRDGKQILSSVPADEWQQRAHDALVSRGWESPWEVCELRLREGFKLERHSSGVRVYPCGCIQHVAFIADDGKVCAYPEGYGAPRGRLLNAIEEAHAYLIEQGSESPWEWVPVSATPDQTETRSSEAYQRQWQSPDSMAEIRAFLNDYMNGNVRPYIGPEPKPHRLNEATAALLESCTDGTGRVFECAKFGTVDALKKRIAELESERDSWKRAAEYASEKIDKACSILS